MRDIKFRAWLTEVKSMVPVRSHRGNCVAVGVAGGEMLGIYGLDEKDPVMGKTAEVMQYIGLKDRNGVEIYEGDIVRAYTYSPAGDDPEEDALLSDFTIHKVTYQADRDYPAYDLEPSVDEEANGIAAFLCTPDYSLEVVGNIYQNPELLEVKP